MAVVGISKFVAGRVRRCRAMMRERGLDGLIVTEPAGVSYLTGFQGDDSVLVLTGKRKVLVTDSRYVLQARKECPGLALKVRKGPITDAAAEVLRGRKYQGKSEGQNSKKGQMTVGMDLNVVTVNEKKSYVKATGVRLKDSKGIVRQLRESKDEYEIRQIRKAIRIAEDSLNDVLASLAVGMSEIEVAARLEYEMARRGGSPAAFRSIVAFGAHAAQPHGLPDRARLRRGQSMLFDWGATVQGYRSDLTRCFVAGKMTRSFADAYRWVLDSQLAGIEAVKPGVPLAEVDRAAREALPAKYPAYGHGTGHGIGLDVHEAPNLGSLSKGVLKEGMVITIEPGCYIPDRLGIRIEDDVLVTANGSEVLSHFAKNPEAVGLRL